jgi:hypothetical protein
LKLSGFELLDRLAHRAGATRDDLDSRGRQSADGIGPTVAGQQDLCTGGYDHLARLDAGTTTQSGVGVLQCFECSLFGVHYYEIRAPAESRIYVCIQRRLGRRDGDELHA